MVDRLHKLADYVSSSDFLAFSLLSLLLPLPLLPVLPLIHSRRNVKVLEVHVKPAPWAEKGSGAHGDTSDDDDDDDDDEEEEDEEEKEEDKDHIAAREMLLILLCNRSLAHLK